MDEDFNRRRTLGERIFKRHRNLWVYMFFGFIAALINTVVFMFMHDFLHTVLVIDNTIAFIVSNLASFWFNHKAVFTKNVDHEHKLWQKLLSFFAYRIISLLPDTLIMWLGTLNSPAISLRFIFWVSRNCASSGEMVIAL